MFVYTEVTLLILIHIFIFSLELFFTLFFFYIFFFIFFAETLIVDDTLRDIGIGLTRLKELIIEECVLVTDEGIIALFDYMPPLESNLYIDERDGGPHGWKKMYVLLGSLLLLYDISICSLSIISELIHVVSCGYSFFSFSFSFLFSLLTQKKTGPNILEKDNKKKVPLQENKKFVKKKRMRINQVASHLKRYHYVDVIMFEVVVSKQLLFLLVEH